MWFYGVVAGCGGLGGVRWIWGCIFEVCFKIRYYIGSRVVASGGVRGLDRVTLDGWVACNEDVEVWTLDGSFFFSPHIHAEAVRGHSVRIAERRLALFVAVASCRDHSVTDVFR